MLPRENKENEKIDKIIGLGTDEKIVFKTRQHWYVFRNPFLLGFFVPFVLLTFIFFLSYLNLPEIIEEVASNLFLYGAFFAFLMGLILFLYRLFLWKRTFYIVTNTRIIIVKQIGVFRHEAHQTTLEKMQDVTCRITGLEANLYGFGDVVVQAATPQASDLVFKRVGRPRKVQRIIMEAISRRAEEVPKSDITVI